MEFAIVRAASPYNVLLGRPGISILKAVPSTIHAMFKFPTPGGVATIITRPSMIVECQRAEKMYMPDVTSKTNEGVLAGCNIVEQKTEEVKVNDKYPEQLVTINAGLSPECKYELKKLLRANMDVFAWKPSDMTGIPRHITEHHLHDNPSREPVRQKRRTLAPVRGQAVTKEVQEWVKAGIVRQVRYPTWISNPMLVKKGDGSWRMCIDFKDINKACPKDH